MTTLISPRASLASAVRSAIPDDLGATRLLTGWSSLRLAPRSLEVPNGTAVGSRRATGCNETATVWTVTGEGRAATVTTIGLSGAVIDGGRK